MSAGTTPRRRRDGWPWPAADAPATNAESDERARAEAELTAAAVGVAQLSEQLRLALLRLEAAQHEARRVAERMALRDAGRLIDRARQPLA